MRPTYRTRAMMRCPQIFIMIARPDPISFIYLKEYKESFTGIAAGSNGEG